MAAPQILGALAGGGIRGALTLLRAARIANLAIKGTEHEQTATAGGKDGLDVKISITGIKELDRAFDNFDKTTKKKHLRKGTRAVAHAVREDAASLVPVDTGFLESFLNKKSSVKALPRSRVQLGHGVMVGESKDMKTALEKAATRKAFRGKAFYGVFIELGTRHIKADPFLRPALYANEKNLLQTMQKAIRDSIAEAGRKGRR